MPETLLILLFGDLGDTILTVPAIRALRERYPHSRVLLLCKAATGRVVRDLALVDEIVAVDKHLFDRPASLLNPRALFALLRLMRSLRRERIDTVVIFHHLVTRWGTLKYALLSLATGARRRVGLDNGRGWFLTQAVQDKGFGDRHESEYWMDVSGLLGARGPLSLEFPVGDADRASAQRKLAHKGIGGEQLLAVHPGTGWYGPGRRWAPERFAAAVSLILEKRSMRCVVLGTEEDVEAATRVLDLLGEQAVSLVNETPLGELGAVLEGCSLLLANDGGVAHVSAAVGTPVIAIFGPSNDRAWRPLQGTVVAADITCRPCFYRDFERGLPNGCATRECLALVTPRMVAGAALALLAEQQGDV